jgi:hypothetical protein
MSHRFVSSVLAIPFLSVCLFAQGVQPYPDAITNRQLYAKTPMAPPPANSSGILNIIGPSPMATFHSTDISLPSPQPGMAKSATIPMAIPEPMSGSSIYSDE